MQIQQLLHELDPENLLGDDELLMAMDPSAPTAVDSGEAASATRADADISDDEDAGEAGLEDGMSITRGAFRRKARLLMELLSAGVELDEKLAAFRGEIDDVMLLMLQRRLQTAAEGDQEPELVEHLRSMLLLLRREHERASSSPGLRLLDEALALLGDEPGLPGYGEARRSVAELLREAFTGGAGRHVDIFAAAAALAEGGALAADGMAVEAVSRDVFLGEASQLLAHAQQQQAALQARLGEVQAELQAVRQQQPQLLSTPEVQERQRQVAHAEGVLMQRTTAIRQLEDVVGIAADLDLTSRVT